MTSPANIAATSALSLQREASTWLTRARTGLRVRWHAYRQQRRDRATHLMLMSLSDRTLDDIGLHRSEIDSVIRSRAAGRRLTYRSVWE